MKILSLCGALSTILGLSLLAAPAGADWLVTRDGSRIETDGEWRVEGRRVLFTLPNGTLSALRLTEVDLDASRAATEEAKNPPPEESEEAEEEPRPEPVLVLTNKDIRQASEAEEDAGQRAQGGDEAGPGAPGLRVVDWNLQPADGGVMLTGRLENGTSRLQSGIRLRIEVRSDEGEILATATSTLTQDTLVAGGIATFRARFPGYDELPGEPTFVIDSAASRQAAETEELREEAPNDG